MTDNVRDVAMSIKQCQPMHQLAALMLSQEQVPESTHPTTNITITTRCTCEVQADTLYSSM